MRRNEQTDSNPPGLGFKPCWQRRIEFIALLKQNLDFKRWGFKISYTDFWHYDDSVVIYDSEWCRVDFDLDYEPNRGPAHLMIQYGRLHAPNAEPFMVWNGEKCHCWHNSWWKPILFLEGFSPREAAHFKGDPPVIEQFWQSKEGELLKGNQVQYVLRIESILWTHYGERLFELFDLRRPDIWEKYVSFMREYKKEYDKIWKPKPIPGWPLPPDDKIC